MLLLKGWLGRGRRGRGDERVKRGVAWKVGKVGMGWGYGV